MILSIGNYMNGSTNRGQADGFDLETLKKINDTKDSNNKVTVFEVWRLGWPRALR